MYKVYGKITDPNIDRIVNDKLNFDDLNKEQIYDIHVDFYNPDLEADMLNADVSYEIKKEHYMFIKKIRTLFEKNQIKVNEFYLMGTIADLPENEINISVLKSKGDKKKNIVWPCKEIFLYEFQKKRLDAMLLSNQISVEDYESNLEFLKDELNIFENDEEHKYIN
ncbi:MAG TPA: hypothetical protein PLV23_06650 [Sedimentibacter sp.]|jgi:hypothetical protein|nr:hypothetical protein [Sedimentibacter sp.]HOK48700.1 hypothetical protein [Sedimentibacter sp.]HOW23294.1 hypothetical protein [Sedimentibacter sp.]HRC81952.1 hypothetical protein [Sedimentibacter sp.]